MRLLVLVVERDDIARETTTYMLEASGYVTVPVATMRMAYDVLNAMYIDVLLVGLYGGDSDWKEFAINSKACQPCLKVVTSGEYLPDSLHGFIDAFVQKPFSLNQIAAAIKEVRPAESRSKRLERP